MSTQNSKRNTSRPAQSRSKKSGTAAAKAKSGGAQAAPEAEQRPLLGQRAINDLIGLGIAIVSVALMVIIFFPSNAIGATLISEGLRMIFGAGAMLLPFILLAWAVTFFLKRRLAYAPIRLAIGLATIFLAIIAVFAVAVPGAADNPGKVFETAMLTSGGGYVGGALAWVLLSLIGQLATIIILIGLVVAGLVFIGLSLTGLAEWIIRTIKNRGRHADDIPLPGSNLVRGAPAAPSSGSAYQMGPDPHGKTKGGSRLLSGRDKQYAHTELLGAAQLDRTVYRSSKELDSKNSTSGSDLLGSARRRLAQGASWSDSDHRAKTVLVNREGSAGQDESSHSETAVLDRSDAPSSDLLETKIIPGGTEKKKAKKASSSKDDNRLSGASVAYKLPSMKLLRISRDKAHTKAGASELRSTANQLQDTLEEFRVDGEVVGWIAGPTVTLFKISLGEGVRLNRITALQSDIQLALAAEAIRIVAPIPGTSLVGIEIPNAARNEVLLGDVLDSARESTLALAIGKDVEGAAIVADLASMPHLLIGGTTGSGKSVAVNSIIMSLLMRTTPEEVRLIMIDPKRVELTLYNGTPHLYVPVVTDAAQAASALAWCVAEMERRLKLFEKHAVKNIKQFNSRVAAHLEELEKDKTKAPGNTGGSSEHGSTGTGALEASEAAVSDGATLEDQAAGGEVDVTVEQENLRATLPYIVIVIDELADLMMLNGKEVETAISRLAQLARAAGLHLIVATQRPSTNVITGLIKANIVNRIAFTVASGIDSRVILDCPGAEDLIGLGDMLFSRPEYSKPVRIQGCLVSEPEIETVVEYWRGQGATDYHEEILLAAPGSSSTSGSFGDDSLEDDPLLWDAAEIVVSSQLGSTSTLQRRLKVGYARAGRIMDMLEMKGVVGPPNGSKPREVLLDDVLDLETLRAFG
ncbi:MAG: DNA translocase FtsK [Coriobacteriia bacterium]|nr:DNA translocase FtsK [Coriobacteriia bacterium]